MNARTVRGVLRKAAYPVSGLRLAAWLMMALALPPCEAQAMRKGQEFREEECYAYLRGSEFTVGNSHIRRTWRIDHGKLFATSILDSEQKVEWISTPSVLPSPSPPRTSSEGRFEMKGGSGVFGPTEAASLRVELRQTSSESETTYTFQVFPNSSAIRMWLSQSGGSKVLTTPAVETKTGELLPADSIEQLQMDRQHLRFTQVILRDRTDEHNELVFENEWLLQPNERSLRLQGNLFFLEDSLTGSGLIFLKEAPQPETRPVQTQFDAIMTGSETALNKTDQRQRTFFEFSFYGHGIEGEEKGYASTLLTYRGGRSGRIAALQRFQRQIRQYEPSRDGQLLSNTWGDRSTNKKLSEGFVRREIDAGSALGVDIVQIDDGWEMGKTLATSSASGVWEGYRSQKAAFWKVDAKRFPLGFLPLTAYAAARDMRVGLWFAPDSSEDFTNWKKDADDLLRWNETDHIAAFKLDSVKIRSKKAEINYRALIERVAAQSSGRILLDLDVTAETRQGYFGNIPAGPLFVENRYTDWHRYWPHQTLRNLWKLAQYVDPLRLRMEFLNPERNTGLYADDPLAPGRYRPGCLFATTMFGSPLGWFENSGLSTDFRLDAAPVIAAWKEHREAMYRGSIIPIGDAPDGVQWTGFESVAEDERSGYLLVFRELNGRTRWTASSDLFAAGRYRFDVLGGRGSVKQSERGFEVEIQEPLGFVWAKVEALPQVKSSPQTSPTQLH